MVLEAAGLGGPQLLLLVVPCLLAGGVGALVFTGFGHWTGLGIGALALPQLPASGTPDAGDFLWGVPVAALFAVVIVAVRSLGWSTAAFAGQRSGVRIAVCAVGVGIATAAYGLFTGPNPEEAALSGQATLGRPAAHPQTWGISLGSLRGGPVFPAVLLGSAIGVACTGLPGFGTASGLSVGLAASGTAITQT